MSKDPAVSDLKSKAQQLIENREHVPGLKDVKKQVRQLDRRWTSLKEISEERRKSLGQLVDDLKAFRESTDRLTGWLEQKEKMMQVLGPMATEPAMVNTQLQQVKLLQEEMINQQPQYEQFIQLGLSILDKCDPESSDAERINSKMDGINHSWDKLETKLGERENSLKDSLNISTKYYEALQGLTDWLSGASEKVEQLPPVSTQPEVIEQQKKDLNKLMDEVTGHGPKVEEVKVLCKQLCDKTKESSTKFDLKNKLASIEKPFNEMTKKLDERKRNLEGAVIEGEKFNAMLTDMLKWVSDKQENMEVCEPLSGQSEKLSSQAREHEVCIPV